MIVDANVITARAAEIGEREDGFRFPLQFFLFLADFARPQRGYINGVVVVSLLITGVGCFDKVA